ncbi:MAG: preprotein translocase subunit SecG [bacterium]
MFTSIKSFLETPNLLNIAQLIFAILMILGILLQNQGSGLGGAFGGDGNVYRTKRGLEKTLFRATIVFSGLFFVTALLNVLF